MTLLDTAITAVTVYPDRARVTRQGQISLEKGAHQLEITELPLKIDPDSARAAARGQVQARLSGVQVQRAFYVETPSEQIHQLEAEIEALQDQLAGMEAQIKLAGQLRANLAELAGSTETYALALASGEQEVGDQLALFDSLRARAGEIDQEILDLGARKRELERQVQKLEKELQRWQGAPRREAYTAIVEVEALDAGELTVELTYVVSAAGWQPLYDIRLTEEEGAAELEIGYLGQIVQRTGEAWESVALTLSTARPALAGTVPELDPWFIRPWLPRPEPRDRAAAAADLVRSMPAAEAGAPPQAAPAEEVEAQLSMASVESSGAALHYRTPAPATIPADGAPHKIAITRYGLKPQLDYVAAPKLAAAAYRRARASNESAYTLLPGQANLFAGEAFIGAAPLDLTAPGGEIELYLGVDDRIRVERELKRRDEDKKLIGGRRRLRYGYAIEVENLLLERISLRLQDQIPVARHEEVKVRLESTDPKPDEHSELNQLTWELSLAPQEKRAVRFDFSVEAPAEMRLIGLD